MNTIQNENTVFARCENSETAKAVNVKTNFEVLLDELEFGISTVQSIATKQNFKAVNERIDGKLTGLKVIKPVGGRVKRTIDETILLNGIQSLAIRKGLNTFGNETVIDFATKTADELLQSIVDKGIEPKLIGSIVSRFLRAQNRVFTLTDLQNVQVLQAVCKSELGTAENCEIATQAQFEKATAEMTAYNNAINAERAELAERLKANAVSA